MRWFYFIVFFSFVTNGFGQNIWQNHIEKVYSQDGSTKLIDPVVIESEEEKFYFPEFIDGSVVLPNGIIVEGQPLRYNILEKHIETLHEGKVYAMKFGSHIKEATLGPYNIVLVDSDKHENPYEVIFVGENATLYKLPRVKYKEVNDSEGPLGTKKGAYKQVDPHYLFVHEDGKEFLVTSKKDIKKLLSSWSISMDKSPKKVNENHMQEVCKAID